MWKESGTYYEWTCGAESGTQLSCDRTATEGSYRLGGNKNGTISLVGGTVIWDATGGRGVYNGNIFISWTNGTTWVKGKLNIAYNN